MAVALSNGDFVRCNRDVEYDELVKEYEIAEDQYVQLMPSELEQLQAAESDAMQIVEFVPLTAIDPIYFEITLHLGAEKQGDTVHSRRGT